MRELQATDDIADCIDMLILRPEMVIHLDEAIFDDDICVFDSDTFDIRHPTDGDEQLIRFKRRLFSVTVDRDRYAVF